ncbi:MAG TPA: hypothetical protein VNL39_12950 [Xanthobacteraceae bacterium]|nr:hypothetical protein [Xanthobacteraceae bacterium]
MRQILRRVAAAPTLAVMLISVPTTASQGDVVVNNVLSPFTAIQIGPGYGRVYGYDYYGGYGGYHRYRYYGEYQYEPALPAYDERPHRYRPRHYRGAGGHAYCWRTTDPDRGYGYWDWCY